MGDFFEKSFSLINLIEAIEIIEREIESPYAKGRIMYDFFRIINYFEDVVKNKIKKQNFDENYKIFYEAVKDAYMGFYFKVYLFNVLEVSGKKYDINEDAERIAMIFSFFEILGIDYNIIVDHLNKYKEVLHELRDRIVSKPDVDEITVNFCYAVYNLLLAGNWFYEENTVENNIRKMVFTDVVLESVERIGYFIERLKLEEMVKGNNPEDIDRIAKLTVAKKLFIESSVLFKMMNQDKYAETALNYLNTVMKLLSDEKGYDFVKNVEEKVNEEMKSIENFIAEKIKNIQE